MTVAPRPLANAIVCALVPTSFKIAPFLRFTPCPEGGCAALAFCFSHSRPCRRGGVGTRSGDWRDAESSIGISLAIARFDMDRARVLAGRCVRTAARLRGQE